MTLGTPYLLNTMAVHLLSNGRTIEAVDEWKNALSGVKKVLDSNKPTPVHESTHAALKNTESFLISTAVHYPGLKNEQYIIPMFNKVFTLAVEDENLLAATLLYNMAVAYSLQRHECSDVTRIFKLYRLALQILHDSGLMWHPGINLFLMALYNNAAHIAFCVHLIQYAEESLRELSLLLLDDSVRCSCKDEDFEFFRSNTLVWANEISLCTSPAA